MKLIFSPSCPLPQAVCCDDHQHCCPNGYTCDTKDGRCLKGLLSVPFFNKIEAIKVEAVPCPDGKSQCPDGSTCCQLASGQWGW
jgi:progranulin